MPKSGPDIFACRHISKKFELIEVLRDVSFAVGRGEKVGLVGPNGSGKTTLLKIIAGKIEKDSGVISHAKDLKIEYLPQIHLDPEKLSGGEMAKKILLPIISSEADFFIMDEPTNNLDVDGLAMIESFVKKSSKAFLIVSHDRAFLDNIVTKIVEIEPKSKSSLVYGGNYSEYIAERKAKIERQWKEYSDKVEKIGKMSSSVEQRLSWVAEIDSERRGTKNLPIHEREKPVAAIMRDKAGKAARRAKVMKNRLERYETDSAEIVKPNQGLPLKVSFDHERGGTKVFDLKGAIKQIGNKKIGPIDLRVTYGDRLHIVGKNGSGKTTLLKILIGELKADSGIVEKGENVKIGYLSQERWQDRIDRQVIEEFLDITKMDETTARELLNRFRITTEDVKKFVSLLSPGEYSRLVIAELVAVRPNCIILDEPSNHLDLEALEELENGLKEYKGTLIVVSHDRYFIGKLGLKSEFDMDKVSEKI